MIIDKYQQLNAILDIYEPNYSKQVVYIASGKIDRSKLDIKLRFSRVNDTNEWAGDWYITRKKARSYRKQFDNNGLNCYVIPLEALERLTISEHSEKEVW